MDHVDDLGRLFEGNKVESFIIQVLVLHSIALKWINRNRIHIKVVKEKCVSIACEKIRIGTREKVIDGSINAFHSSTTQPGWEIKERHK